MKSLKFLFIAVWLVCAPVFCAENSTNLLDKLFNTESELATITLQSPDLDTNFSANFTSFMKLVATFNHFKDYDVKFTTSLLNKLKNNDTLTGDELFLLRRLVTTYYKLNQKMLEFSDAYDLGGYDLSTAILDLGQNVISFKENLIWLSGNLLVIDHLETIHNILYEQDGTLRRIVKNALLEKDSDADKTLRDLMKIDQDSLEIARSKKFGQQIVFVRAVYDEIDHALSNDDEAMLLLDEIYNNPTAIAIAQGKAKFNLRRYDFTDTLVSVLDKTIGWFSKVFGNIAGAISTRVGHMLHNQKALKVARENLRPMDIIFDKSPFILTDAFIPGYFDHVALYLGTKEQLIATGLWDHPAIKYYQRDIENGKVILEAVRSGVRLTSLEDFMNIDELLIIRKDDALANLKILNEQMWRAMDQIGKPYDFNFDLSTIDKIVCSELLYVVYGNVHWPTEYRLGRPTISPDNIAEILFFKQTKFKIQSYVMAKKSTKVKVKTNIEAIANKLSYELRAADGSQVVNHNDQTNNFWKVKTKCHLETVEKPYSDAPEETVRVCNSTYQSFDYLEQVL